MKHLWGENRKKRKRHNKQVFWSNSCEWSWSNLCAVETKPELWAESKDAWVTVLRYYNEFACRWINREAISPPTAHPRWLATRISNLTQENWDREQLYLNTFEHFITIPRTKLRLSPDAEKQSPKSWKSSPARSRHRAGQRWVQPYTLAQHPAPVPSRAAQGKTRPGLSNAFRFPC